MSYIDQEQSPSLPPNQLLIGPDSATKPITITLKCTTGYNSTSVRDLLVGVLDAMKANMTGGVLTSDWGHHVEFEITFGSKGQELRLR